MNTPKISFSSELIAPCGMNCALCSGYLAYQYDVKSVGIRMPYCTGCRPRDKQCAFLKKKCLRLLNHTVQFCYECNSYPCENLTHIDQRYQKLFRTSLIDNLECIKKKGMTRFLQMQKEKWQCEKCGGIHCCHNPEFRT